MSRYNTALKIVQDVMKKIGLPTPGTVVGNTDATVVQMLQLLQDLGQELAKRADWQMFSRTHTMSVITPTLEYAVPSDLDFYIPNTGWNNTARIPLIGPLTDQQWALLQARQLGGTTLYLQFTQQQDKIVFYFAPTTAQSVTINYRGRGWVQAALSATTFQDEILLDADSVLFDPLLVRMGLNLAWRQAKGFDVTKLQADFEIYLDEVQVKDKASPDLHISRQRSYPYIGIYNLPDTGFGSSS